MLKSAVEDNCKYYFIYPPASFIHPLHLQHIPYLLQLRHQSAQTIQIFDFQFQVHIGGLIFNVTFTVYSQ